MGVTLLVVAVLVVLAIALVAVGKVVAESAGTPRQSVFDLEEAVEYVADRLSPEVQARLTLDEVRTLLGWHLDYLEARGIAYVRAATSEGPGEGDASARGPNVVEDDHALGWVLGRASEAGLDLDDVDVLAVLDVELEYLRAIGAVGAEVPPPDEIDASD